ncbi:chondroitin proteoglycan 2-like isoform X1 [Centruroides sculpturatus]|uniref:chondroitin proteoglycan 2-like isoform X1 n=1 Tax=Centruroides sculpturatus TaxID=218467 RepID=UPI000C6DB966|nr:chondroitin proteoglycan 2-like isoform X1 [Centruroides sculpturatus]
MLSRILLVITVHLALLGYFAIRFVNSATIIKRNQWSSITSCPCSCCLLPSATDCKTYYLCLDNELFERKCEDGELFNPILENCDFEDRVMCLITTPSPTLNPFECPTANGLFKNPADCSTFYQCSNYIPYLHNCPASLHYNEDKEQCDYPENANCDNSTGSRTRITTAQPEIDKNCTQRSGMFPYTNSSLYLQCENWHGKVRSCPPDTLYDYENWICTINKTALVPLTVTE